MINSLSSRRGILSQGQGSQQLVQQSFDSEDIVVMVANEKFIVGRSEKLKSVEVSYSVKGGGVCNLDWNNNLIAKIGAPCSVYIGSRIFWSGIITTSNGTKWTAEPLQKVLSEIYFYDPAYDQQSFEGYADQLLRLAFDYAIQQTNYLSLGILAVPNNLVTFDINSKTILEIIEFVANQDNDSEYVYGVNNKYEIFFTSIAKTASPIKIYEDEYGGDINITSETDNVITVLSVFKNREVRVFNEETLETESVYPVNFIGKVGIGVDPISNNNFPPVTNYYRFGHKEDRFEIDAPDMSNTTALEEAYRALRNYQITQKYSIKQYDYKSKPIEVGTSVELFSKNGTNVSIYVDIANEGVVLPAKFDGSLMTINETSINESDTASVSNEVYISTYKEWLKQASIVDNIIEVSIGYLANFDGSISITSGEMLKTFSVTASKLIQYVTLSGDDLDGFDKTSIKLSSTGNIRIINMYAIADYGQASYVGYLRSVKLTANYQGDYFTLDVQNYNSKPVLTFQKLTNQIRQVASISLK